MNDRSAKSVLTLDSRSRDLRRLILRALKGGNRGHLGAAMSLVEILRVLFDHYLNYRSDDPCWPDRDRFILSKGHGCLALYAVLVDKGFFSKTELDRFCHSQGILGGHPEAGKVPGVEASTGALGHGLPIGVGMALAGKIRQKSYRVVVVVGDGELNEGSNWEAAMSAAKHRLSNLTIFIDYNKFQSYGPTSEVLDLEPLADKWRSFGFSTNEIDGHDVDAMKNLVESLPLTEGQPTVVVCHTVKGGGFPFAESRADWHHKSRFSEEEIQSMHAALGMN
jgi:transketolase